MIRTVVQGLAFFGLLLLVTAIYGLLLRLTMSFFSRTTRLPTQRQSLGQAAISVIGSVLSFVFFLVAVPSLMVFAAIPLAAKLWPDKVEYLVSASVLGLLLMYTLIQSPRRARAQFLESQEPPSVSPSPAAAAVPARARPARRPRLRVRRRT